MDIPDFHGLPNEQVARWARLLECQFVPISNQYTALLSLEVFGCDTVHFCGGHRCFATTARSSNKTAISSDYGRTEIPCYSQDALLLTEHLILTQDIADFDVFEVRDCL